jgi:hypothetical protein
MVGAVVVVKVWCVFEIETGGGGGGGVGGVWLMRNEVVVVCSF